MTKKSVTVHKALNPRDVIEALSGSRKGLANNKDCLHASIKGFEVYIKRTKRDHLMHPKILLAK